MSLTDDQQVALLALELELGGLADTIALMSDVEFGDFLARVLRADPLLAEGWGVRASTANLFKALTALFLHQRERV